MRKFLPCYASLVVIAIAQSPQRPEMTARELFYNAGPAAESKPQAKKGSGKTTAKKTPSTPTVQQAGATPPTAPPTEISHPTAPVITAADTVPMRTTAPPPVNGTPLGLKYTILKLVGDQMMPVAPSSVFHANDKIQFSIETNGPGYLYIVSQGSSGTWKPMFPSPEIDGGSSAVEGFHTYIFPSGYRYVFDPQAGEEKVYLIFSRDAKPDFEQMVYSLQGRTSQPASEPHPAQQPAAGPVLRASIDDATVGRLHQTYARDLVIEKVGDDAGANNQEKAVYVVNPSGSPDSALVADLHLVHQ